MLRWIRGYARAWRITRALARMGAVKAASDADAATAHAALGALAALTRRNRGEAMEGALSLALNCLAQGWEPPPPGHPTEQLNRSKHCVRIARRRAEIESGEPAAYDGEAAHLRNLFDHSLAGLSRENVEALGAQLPDVHWHDGGTNVVKMFKPEYETGAARDFFPND